MNILFVVSFVILFVYYDLKLKKKVKSCLVSKICATAREDGLSP